MGFIKNFGVNILKESLSYFLKHSTVSFDLFGQIFPLSVKFS